MLEHYKLPLAQLYTKYNTGIAHDLSSYLRHPDPTGTGTLLLNTPEEFIWIVLGMRMLLKAPKFSSVIKVA